MPDSSENSRAERVLATLESAIAEDRLAHGILLFGKDLPALEIDCLRLTRLLLGMAEDARQHPDLHELRPEGAARQIRVKATRFLITALNHAPSHGIRKVAIVHEADRMSQGAANAFLKTLEEPPANTTIFLVSTKPNALLLTVRSRCQRFRLDSKTEMEKPTEWIQWLDCYRVWLHSLRDDSQVRSDPSRIVMGTFGLVYRFEGILSEFTASAWEKIRPNLPEDLNEKELKALESGCRKGIRDKLFIDIETETHAFAVEQGTKGDFPAKAFAQSVETLEKMVGLMQVNLKETIALEHFLLHSLRIWTAR